MALKQIRRELADDPQSRARFLVEAEVTGGLEHPGVVPVYALGFDDPAYFSRVYAAATGLSPRAFRARLQGSEE